MKVVQLKIKDEDRNIKHLRQSQIDPKLGMLEESSKRDKNRQISLLSKEARDLMIKEKSEGMCVFKFYENMTIEGLDPQNLRVGQRLKIGQSIQEITSIGKKCFDGCKLAESEEKCQLASKLVYTQIIKGGIVKVDDYVSYLDK